MKPTNLLATALLALGGAALLAPPAKAQSTVITSFVTGDLLLGFSQANTPNDLLVDVGAASNYLNATNSFVVQFGYLPGTSTPVTSLNADLSATFGLNWADNTQTDLVQWGLAGDTDHFSNVTFGLPKNTLFLTTSETTPGTLASPLHRFPSTASGSYDGTINSLETGLFGYANSTSTINSSVAVIQPTSQANSWFSFNPNLNAFGTGYDITQQAAGTYIGPTNSVLDLYELQPGSLSSSGIYVGSFSLGSNGSLTFTPPVPEPATIGLFASAVGLLAGNRRRRVPSIARTLSIAH